MKTEITTREAVKNDVPDIVELWKEFIDFHKERNRFFSRSVIAHEKFAEFIAGHIANESSCVLVAELDDLVVGHCLATISKYPPIYDVEEYGQIMDLAVTDKYRRKGVGETLVNAIRSWFLARGIHRAEVKVAVSNEVSVAFWRKMGFAPYLETLCREI